MNLCYNIISVKLSGEKVIQYSDSRLVTLPNSTSTTETIGPYETILTTTTGSEGMTYTANCTTTFTISTSVIVNNWSYRGNNCYATKDQ